MRKNIRIVATLSLLLILTLWSTLSVLAQTPTPGNPVVRITQVDNSKFPQVTVYVSVTDASGQPVGVDPSTIQLSENGQVMQTKSAASGGPVTKGPGQITTLLVIDVSGSMATDNKLQSAKTAADAYVDQMRPGDQAGVEEFDTHFKVVQAITADHQTLKSAIDSLQSGSDTAMFDALTNGVQLLANVSGRKAIIVLTDGMDNRSKGNEDAVIKAIGPSGLTISTIGLGDRQATGSLAGIDEAALKSLAQKAGGVYSYEPDPSQLASLFQQYGQALQSEYALTYTSPSTLRDGVNRNLTVSLTGSAVTASSQYNPGGVLPEVPRQSWILFAGILVGLLVLMAIPLLVGRFAQGFGGSGGGSKKGRIKLGEAPGQAAKGRVRLK